MYIETFDYGLRGKPRRDCFAYDSVIEYCTATTNETCIGCAFYKHSDNPLQERLRIEKELALRYSLKNP